MITGSNLSSPPLLADIYNKKNFVIKKKNKPANESKTKSADSKEIHLAYTEERGFSKSIHNLKRCLPK